MYGGMRRAIETQEQHAMIWLHMFLRPKLEEAFAHMQGDSASRAGRRPQRNHDMMPVNPRFWAMHMLCK